MGGVTTQIRCLWIKFLGFCVPVLNCSNINARGFLHGPDLESGPSKSLLRYPGLGYNDASIRSWRDLSCDGVCVFLSVCPLARSLILQPLVFMLERKANDVHLSGQQRNTYDRMSSPPQPTICLAAVTLLNTWALGWSCSVFISVPSATGCLASCKTPMPAQCSAQWQYAFGIVNVCRVLWIVLSTW